MTITSFLTATGTAFICIAICLYLRTSRWQRQCSAHTPGRIVDNVYVKLGKESTKTWHPTAAYAIGNKMYSQVSWYGAKQKKYKIGDDVTVCYDPNNHSDIFIKGQVIGYRHIICFSSVIGICSLLASVLCLAIQNNI